MSKGYVILKENCGDINHYFYKMDGYKNETYPIFTLSAQSAKVYILDQIDEMLKVLNKINESGNMICKAVSLEDLKNDKKTVAKTIINLCLDDEGGYNAKGIPEGMIINVEGFFDSGYIRISHSFTSKDNTPEN